MIPMDMHKALEVINKHTVHDLDYGIINGIPFSVHVVWGLMLLLV